MRLCACSAQGRVLIADSWFGSVACALALFSLGIFCVMNVKTAHKGFPKKELMEVVGEVKGSTADAKERRRARRGAQIAYTKKFPVGGNECAVLAAGHNKRVPLLLVATHGSMNKGEDHVKCWKTPNAGGGETWHKITTPQPYVHELYRNNMNTIDLHNRLRSGCGSMADVWRTNCWTERHFAELLGFIEVNIYKCLTYFYPEHKDLSHPQFRIRLAWTLMTLGEVEFPTERAQPAAAQDAKDVQHHEYVSYNGNERHSCGYCGKEAYQYCSTCKSLGLGEIAVCGRRTGRDCMTLHAKGEPLKHGSWRKRSASSTSSHTPSSGSGGNTFGCNDTSRGSQSGQSDGSRGSSRRSRRRRHA